MLATAFRNGLATARAAGWRGYALALLSYVPVVAAEASGNVAVAALTLVVQVVVVLALIRLLGAYRAEPVPPPAQVDEQGRRVLPPPNPGPPLGDADRRVGGALRNALRLGRPALAMSGLILLAQVAAVFTIIALSGGKAVDYSATVLLLTALPVSALFLAFILLAPQRIALEGETRVLVATAHSVRIARSAYGVLLLLTIVEPAVTSVGSLLVPDKDPPIGLLVGVGSVTLLVAAVLQVVTTATANEVYLSGPRLDLPADPGEARQ
ncbi:MAG TPA: hypothetical protein VNA14_11760 [Mycobacteriales bacterium]|nr:hypothetical protein [Mycobacteriales bacterium]